jgi:glycosyltransferase involved in cell wall biosynthesis
MSGTKLTVGIPTFNRAHWLAETIDSVLGQTFASFRLIVSDNASTDDTTAVVHSFDDDRIDYVRSDCDVGAIGNLNRLISLTTTEFLVLVPDDDILYPGHLESTVGVLERFATVGLAHSAFDFINERSRPIRRVNPVTSRSPVTIERRDRALERLMVSRWGLCFASVAYRTKAIVDAGGFREEDEPFGDRNLWMRIALDWDFGYIAKPLVGFRTHSQTITLNVGAEADASSDLSERVRLHSQINFQRRMDFLEDAPLASRRKERLRALARLQLLVEDANSGLSWKEAVSRFANLLRLYPQIVMRRALWRLVVAQLGGRRVRSALREVAPRRHQIGQEHRPS